jgi:hypothetical protein
MRAPSYDIRVVSFEMHPFSKPFQFLLGPIKLVPLPLQTDLDRPVTVFALVPIAGELLTMLDLRSSSGLSCWLAFSMQVVVLKERAPWLSQDLKGAEV